MSTQTEETRKVNQAEPSMSERTLPFNNSPAPSKSSRAFWLVIVAVAIAATVLVTLLYTRHSIPEEEAAPVAANSTGTVQFLMEQQWLIRMKLAQVEEKQLARQITATGRIVPAANHHALVAPPLGGIISGMSLPRVGQYVKQGESIAVLQQKPTAAEAAQVAAGNTQLRIEQARMEAERRRLTQSVNEAEARLIQAKAEFERAQRLYERKAYSQRQLQAADADFKAAQSVLASASDQVSTLNESKSKLTEVGIQTSYNIAAPISGTIVKVNKTLGEQVTPGEAIVEIVNLDTVWVEAPIFERDLFRLSRNSQVIFNTPTNPSIEYQGKVIDMGAVIDEKTRAATVLFEVPNQSNTLKVGMQANVRLDAGETVNAMVVPKEAVLEHEGKKIVYVLLSGEEFQRREVTLGDEYGDKVAIFSGLQNGERVVTQGALQLKLQELRPASAGAHTHET